jgi:hypothetical protein
MRSTASSIATGPTLQLHPMTSTPHSSSLGVKVSGVEPSRQFPSSSMVTCATTGNLRIHVTGSQYGLMQFFQITEGLQHQQVDAAFDQSRNLLPERGTSFLERGFPQRLNAHSEWSDRSGDKDIKALGGFTGQPRSGKVDFAYLARHAVSCEPK